MKATAFATLYPLPWHVGDREVLDVDGCHVTGFEDDPDEREFWRGVVEYVNCGHAALAKSVAAAADDDCPGHVASASDPKVCARCGIHIDELRPPADDPVNLQGSGPVPIAPREG